MNHEKQYIQLQQDIKPYVAMLSQAADTILDQEVSRYPIFVVHRFDLELGIPLIEYDEPQPKWSINATTLEEMVIKRLIEMDRVDNFRKVYKNPREFLCLFTWNETGANFIFMPRNE